MSPPKATKMERKSVVVKPNVKPKLKPQVGSKAAPSTSTNTEEGPKMATTGVPNVYKFKVSLKYPKPKIWRSILVPETYNFCELHEAIQDIFQWSGVHLHKFEIINKRNHKRVVIMDQPFRLGFGDEEEMQEKSAKIATYFTAINDKATYDYDFGSTWYHDIVLENILPAVPGAYYPQCISGRRASPHEEFGILDDPEALPDHLYEEDEDEEKTFEERVAELMGPNYDPAVFDPKAVKFRNLKVFCPAND